MMELSTWVLTKGNNIACSYKELIQFFVAFGTLSSVFVALYIATKNNRRDTFERNFSLLLEQHNDQLKSLLSRKDFGDKLSSILGLGSEKDLISCNKRMHQLDAYYGSYFRVLYYLLKHIDKNYYGADFLGKKRKFYTSMVRSFLGSEITLLLIINISHGNEENQYREYRRLIEKYMYLEHLILDGDTFASGCSESVRNGLMLEDSYNTENYVTGLEVLDDICKEYPISSFGNNDWKKLVLKVKDKNSNGVP
ncbi:Putative phage abortive infection protein [Kosakonia sacchari]|uniref:Phage abortive infection protein n=2 Tax=Kosakonia sacchari TaxID=1158459 RepID=A0A1G4XHC5_9ENTR|nr:Putative phage abortive infection protein [Kosakonia sacchari]